MPGIFQAKARTHCGRGPLSECSASPRSFQHASLRLIQLEPTISGRQAIQRCEGAWETRCLTGSLTRVESGARTRRTPKAGSARSPARLGWRDLILGQNGTPLPGSHVGTIHTFPHFETAQHGDGADRPLNRLSYIGLISADGQVNRPAEVTRARIV